MDKFKRRRRRELSREEAQQFDQELSEDKAMAQEYEKFDIEEDLIDFAAEEDLLSEIKKIGKERQLDLSTNAPVKIIPFRRWGRVLSIAAGLALLVTAYFVLQNSGSTSPQNIALNSYNAAPPNLSGTKAIGDDPQALEKYKGFLNSSKEEEVKEAVTFFESEKQTSPEAAYYLGHAYWQLADYPKSIQNFEFFLQNVDKSDRLFSNAEFYKIHSLLANNQVEEAQKTITQIKEGHLFQKKLEELLQELSD